MRLLEIDVTNFGSYKRFSFDFTNRGLVLIQGHTGSGKSTALDAVVWMLYGQTAKDGNADDIRSWFCSEDEETHGILNIGIGTSSIGITRIRGKVNDLYWVEESSEEVHRGKDLTETQKLLEKRLGVSS